MGPENVISGCIGVLILFYTVVARSYVLQEHRKYLWVFGVIGCFFVLLGMLPR